MALFMSVYYEKIEQLRETVAELLASDLTQLCTVELNPGLERVRMSRQKCFTHQHTYSEVNYW